MEMSVYLYTVLMIVALFYSRRFFKSKAYDFLIAGFLILTGIYMAVNLTTDYLPLFLFVIFSSVIFMLKRE